MKFIAEKLKLKNQGTFLIEESGKEQWEEPEASDVEEEVWTEIRKAGFGAKVRNRDLRRIWKRRASIRERIELLELGKAGGVFRKAKRTAGKVRRMCVGEGVRSMVVLEPVPKRRRVEGEEEEKSVEEQGEQEMQVAVKKGKQSLLKEVFEQVKSTFESWRLGGLYVDPEVFLSIT